jgi:hypothetical protein
MDCSFNNTMIKVVQNFSSFFGNHCTDYMWLLNDESDAPKIPSGKGKRLIVLHAGARREGLI